MLREAQATVHTARRQLTAAIVAAYRAGESAARIAERTGASVTDIRNLLAAARTSRRG
ncbi:helix-turn-helix domain-containing protein [Streptomyces sp. NPDC059909]|uniref:helix-turn-helix domain-containing protein n=1 Tax=Streptomyces sp. NPDC059909 TaxID=3346998 RepID=UPI0036562B57